MPQSFNRKLQHDFKNIIIARANNGSNAVIAALTVGESLSNAMMDVATAPKVKSSTMTNNLN